MDRYKSFHDRADQLQKRANDEAGSKTAKLRAFVEQMSRLTTTDDEYNAQTPEGRALRKQYANLEEYEDGLGDDRLCGEFSAFQQMIEKAREILK